MSFSKLSNRDEFGYPLKFKSASEAGLVKLERGGDANTKLSLDFEDFPFADNAVGNTIPATITNSGVTRDMANKKFGKSSALFSSAYAYLDCSVPKTLMENSDFSLEFFAYPTALSGRVWALNQDTATAYTFALGFENTSVLVSVRAGAYKTGGTVTLNTWHHIKMVKHDSKAYAFLDGVKVIDNITFSPVVYVDTMRIGAALYDANTYKFSGNIDEVRLQFGDMSEQTGATCAVPDKPF